MENIQLVFIQILTFIVYNFYFQFDFSASAIDCSAKWMRFSWQLHCSVLLSGFSYFWCVKNFKILGFSAVNAIHLSVKNGSTPDAKYCIVLDSNMSGQIHYYDNVVSQLFYSFKFCNNYFSKFYNLFFKPGKHSLLQFFSYKLIQKSKRYKKKF